MNLKILGIKEANAINNINEKDLDVKLGKLFTDNISVNSCLMDNVIAPEGGEDVDLFNTLLKEYNMAEGNKCKEKEDILQKKNEDIPIKDKIEEIKELDINNKEHIMKMINTQDFIEGYWEENPYTKKIKDKYKKEYNLIKGLKNKNIDDNIALTILIIYFINKEHSELLNDLLMIIKKAKIFIEKKTKDKYENIIKKSGIN